MNHRMVLQKYIPPLLLELALRDDTEDGLLAYLLCDHKDIFLLWYYMGLQDAETYGVPCMMFNRILHSWASELYVILEYTPEREVLWKHICRKMRDAELEMDRIVLDFLENFRLPIFGNADRI